MSITVSFVSEFSKVPSDNHITSYIHTNKRHSKNVSAAKHVVSILLQ